MENIAGIKRIQYALASTITWLAPASEGVFRSFPEWVGNADWQALSFTYLTGSLSFSPAVGPLGFVYTINSQAIRAKVSLENLQEFNALLGKNLLLLITDRNNQEWLIGSVDYPVQLAYKATFGTNNEELNQLPLTITGAQPHLPGIYGPFNNLMQNGNEFVFQNNDTFLYN